MLRDKFISTVLNRRRSIQPQGKPKPWQRKCSRYSLPYAHVQIYPAGYFHVYKEMAKQDVDVVIHLGDYIYEYGMGGDATEEAVEMGRTLADDNNA